MQNLIIHNKKFNLGIKKMIILIKLIGTKFNQIKVNLHNKNN